MTPVTPSLDGAFVAAFRSGTLTAAQVEAVLPRDRPAVIFLLLHLSATLANKSDSPAATVGRPLSGAGVGVSQCEQVAELLLGGPFILFTLRELLLDASPAVSGAIALPFILFTLRELLLFAADLRHSPTNLLTEPRTGSLRHLEALLLGGHRTSVVVSRRVCCDMCPASRCSGWPGLSFSLLTAKRALKHAPIVVSQWAIQDLNL